MKYDLDIHYLDGTTRKRLQVPFAHPSEHARELHIPERLKKSDFSVLVGGYEGNSTMIVDLEERGYRVATIPEIREDSRMYFDPIFDKLLLRWIRDAFWDTGNQLFISGKIPAVTTLLERLGLKIDATKILDSPFGEQGNVVSDGNIALVSQRLVNHEHVQLLLDQGMRVFGIPIPTFKDLTGYLSGNNKAIRLYKKMVETNDHIDMHIALFFNSSGEKLLLVTKEYQEIFGTFIEDLSERIGAKLHIHAGPHVNFPILPDGCVLVEDTEAEIKDLLENFLGREKVATVHYSSSERSGRARCATNFLRG